MTPQAAAEAAEGDGSAGVPARHAPPAPGGLQKLLLPG